MANWNFLTNHFLVLAHISQRSDSTGREIAEAIGITERSVREIVVDLHTSGFIELERAGRRNHYRVIGHRPIAARSDLDAPTVGDLLGLFRS